MDFQNFRKQLILKNIRDSNKATEEYRHAYITNKYLNQPYREALQPPMPFISSHTNYGYGGYQFNHLRGGGLVEDNQIRSILKRNAEQRIKNAEELHNEENGIFETSEVEADITSQKQSLELYFNELQDGGFGGTDINRENTRKALFNLKTVGLSLNLSTIQRFIDIINEFIDSFVLSVKNPQFSEILSDGTQRITSAKRIEIIKASLKNLDSIENVLRLLKVLDALEDTYNTQDIQREPIFEDRFNDIIEAKPTQYIPAEIRALLTKANKTFDKIKDNLDSIQEVRQNVVPEKTLSKIQSKDLDMFKTDILNKFEKVAQNFIDSEFSKVKKSVENRLEWDDKLKEVVISKEESLYESFFTSKQVRSLLSDILSNKHVTPKKRQAILNLINNQGEVIQNLQTGLPNIMNGIELQFINILDDRLDKIDDSNERYRKQLDINEDKLQGQKHKKKVPAPKPVYDFNITKDGIIKDEETKILTDDELLKEMKILQKEIPKPPKGRKPAKIKLVINLDQAEKQLQKIKESLNTKTTPHTRQMEIIRLQNAQMVVNMIKQNSKLIAEKAREEREEQLKADALEQAQAELAQVQPPKARRAKKAKQAVERDEEQEDIDEMRNALEDLDLPSDDEDQTGKGKRVPSRKLKQKGGKTVKIDNEHKQRLRALLM